MSSENLKLLEHFRKPRNVGIIENADGYGSAKNPVSGYQTDIYVKVKDNQIDAVKFKSVGCVATIASSSGLTVALEEKSLDDLLQGENSLEKLLDLVKEEIGEVPDKNWHCPPTSIMAFLLAVLDYYKKNKFKDKVENIESILSEVDCYFKKGLKD